MAVEHGRSVEASKTRVEREMIWSLEKFHNPRSTAFQLGGLESIGRYESLRNEDQEQEMEVQLERGNLKYMKV
jgi:plasmid stability protein